MGEPSRTSAMAPAATRTTDRWSFLVEGVADLMDRRRDVRAAFDTLPRAAANDHSMF